MSANRFRFRAWEPPNRLIYDIQTSPVFGEYLESKELIIMQSTGLVDRNKKEIFEGDIVRDRLGLIGFIKWDEHDLAVGLAVECIKLAPWYMHESTQWEIIGNIYQNPELLK